MKDPTAIGNYPHFYSTSCSSSYPCFLSPHPLSLSLSLPFRHFYISSPLLPSRASYLEFLSSSSGILSEDDFSRSISRFSLPRCIWRSLFKPAKSRIVDYLAALDRHVESFRGTPCGFRPRSRAKLEPTKGLSLSGQSELTFVTCHPISRLVMMIFIHLPPGLYWKYIF